METLVASPEGGPPVPVRELIATVFGIERSGPGVFPGEWGAVGMLCALCGGYFGAAYLGLRFLQHQKR